VERDEGGLADGSDQQQVDPDRHRRPGRRVGQDLGDAERPGLVTDQERTDEQHQTAEGGDHQGLDGRAAAGTAVGVVADEEEGEDRGQLPEHVEEEQVVSQDQAEHRADEGDEDTGEAGHPG
jgi:hypothetical protein